MVIMRTAMTRVEQRTEAAATDQLEGGPVISWRRIRLGRCLPERQNRPLYFIARLTARSGLSCQSVGLRKHALVGLPAKKAISRFLSQKAWPSTALLIRERRRSLPSGRLLSPATSGGLLPACLPAKGGNNVTIAAGILQQALYPPEFGKRGGSPDQ
jgi:hypothetical protein